MGAGTLITTTSALLCQLPQVVVGITITIKTILIAAATNNQEGVVWEERR